MAYRIVQDLIYCPKYLRTKQHVAKHSRIVRYHCSEVSYDDPLPCEWYEKSFSKLTKLKQPLKDLDTIDGRLVNVNDYSVVVDDHLHQSMHSFKSLARVFLGSPIAQQALRNIETVPHLCFSKPREREPMTVSSLTRVCNFLNISAQQRKLVRLAICPQVTQHQIWTGVLEEILSEIKLEIEFLNHCCPSKGTMMAQQIVSSCLKFLDAASSYDPNSTSWMHLTPAKDSDSPTSHKWEDVLEMCNDLMNCLKKEKESIFHFTKLEVMKEGLSQIKDVLIDKNIKYRETRHQQSLVQKKLTRTLGHSSRCLFSLLLFYLYGVVRDVEVDICGGIYEGVSRDKVFLCMGKILTSNEEKMVQSGVKQLDRALGLFKFVWETAKMKGALELQGHLWCVGAEDTSLTYKGNSFFVHGISL